MSKLLFSKKRASSIDLIIPDVAGYSINLDVSVHSSIVFNGSDIQQLTDLSGNGFNAVQLTQPNQFAYVSGNCYGDGSDFFNVQNFTQNWNADDWTIFSVVSADADNTGTKGIFTNRPGFGSWVTLGNLSGVETILVETGGGGIVCSTGFDARGQGLHIYTLRKTGNTLSLKVNNGAYVSNDVSALNLGGITQSLFIGFWTASSNAWKGNINKFLLYESSLLDALVTEEIQILADKWSITL